jgi:hypothetical protein
MAQRSDRAAGMGGIAGVDQRILAVMPLHAIVAVYGEQELRARLVIETARLDDASHHKVMEAL